jgi:mannose-6-phosphate isomerase-like protein (cupin superfamily)
MVIILAAFAGFVAGAATVHSTDQVVFIPASEVQAAFAKAGGVLAKGDTYQIQASRRDAPGRVEVHPKQTDLIYMLEGTATLVTDGAVAGGKTTADEVRGSTIENGQVRTLRKGDIVIVPKGVPHWFKEVSSPVLYYLVKVQ